MAADRGDKFAQSALAKVENRKGSSYDDSGVKAIMALGAVVGAAVLGGAAISAIGDMCGPDTRSSEERQRDISIYRMDKALEGMEKNRE